MASDTNGSKPNLKDQIAYGTGWTAAARASSIMTAILAVVASPVIGWVMLSIVELKETTATTAVQLDSFKSDAEHSRTDTKERMDRMTTWISSQIAHLSDRVDALQKN